MNMLTKVLIIGGILVLGLSIIGPPIIAHRNGDFEEPLNDLYTFLPSGYETVFAGLSTLGATLFVSGVLAYGVHTRPFLDAVTKALKQIVVTKEFLRGLNPKERESSALDLVTGNKEINDYPEIHRDYMRRKVMELLEASKVCVRRDYNIVEQVSFDHASGAVISESTITYRYYRSSIGYEDVHVGFVSVDGNSKSGCLSYIVKDENGCILDQGSHLSHSLKTFMDRGPVEKGFKLDLNRIAADHEYVNLEFKLQESGRDHWILSGFLALHPTDRWSFSLHCDEPCHVRDYHIYSSDDHAYNVSLGKEKETHLEVRHTGWIEPGEGLAVLVAVDHDNVPTSKANSINKAE